jgi:hypothetical protein
METHEGVLLDSMQTDRDLWIKVGREKLEAVEKERDEARAEVAKLKQALHDARLENSGQAAQLERAAKNKALLLRCREAK